MFRRLLLLLGLLVLPAMAQSSFTFPVATGGAPTGAAGGDLTGTYPNPGVGKIGGQAVPLYVANNNVTKAGSGAVTLIGAGSGTLTLPANYFTTDGTVLHFYASGQYGTAASPGGLRFQLFVGGSVAGSGITTPTASESSVSWSMNCYVSSRAHSGSTSTLSASCSGPSVQNGIFAGDNINIGLIDQTLVVTTTGTLVIDFQVAWTAFASGDTITCSQFILLPF